MNINPTGQDRLTFIYQDEWGELMSPGPVREDGPYAWMIEETIPLSAPRAATENPFNVEIMEHRDATRLFVEYDTGSYAESTARRYAELFRESLAWLLAKRSARRGLREHQERLRFAPRLRQNRIRHPALRHRHFSARAAMQSRSMRE